MLKIIFNNLTGALLGCAIAFIVIYFNRLRSIATLKKRTDFEDGFNLYSMTVKYSTDIQRLINSGFKDTQSFVDEIVKEALPLLPIHMKLPEYGCSCYRAATPEGGWIMGRNYDFKQDTSCLAMQIAPSGGYRSVCFAALSNMSVKDPFSSLKARMSCLLGPLAVLEGINEKGVSMAVLMLDSESVNQHTGRGRLTSSLAIRLVLDNAASTDEAIRLMSKYDMMAVNGSDYHYFITDATGNSVIIEYDCLSPERKLTVIPVIGATNFYAMYIDKVLPDQKNGIFGHGRERYDRMMALIEPLNDVLDSASAWAALDAAATYPDPVNTVSPTQYSIVFNNTNRTADVVIRRSWDTVTTFTVGED